jgi:uncharacterized protein YutE (UPF0331/DUF86 family)
MSKELILKKIEQLKALLKELKELLETPLPQFTNDFKTIRAAERNFELIVEIASDVNTHLLLEAGKKTPDTYAQSFLELAKEGALSNTLAAQLVATAKLRNILVHEYDFEEDNERFYHSARAALPAYEEYIKAILAHVPK